MKHTNRKEVDLPKNWTKWKCAVDKILTWGWFLNALNSNQTVPIVQRVCMLWFHKTGHICCNHTALYKQPHIRNRITQIPNADEPEIAGNFQKKEYKDKRKKNKQEMIHSKQANSGNGMNYKFRQWQRVSYGFFWEECLHFTIFFTQMRMCARM